MRYVVKSVAEYTCCTFQQHAHEAAREFLAFQAHAGSTARRPVDQRGRRQHQKDREADAPRRRGRGIGRPLGDDDGRGRGQIR